MKNSIQGSLLVMVAALLISAFSVRAQIVPDTSFKSNKEGSTIIIKLKDGDTLFTKLTAACKMYNIQSGLILTGIGQLRNFTIGLYDVGQKKFLPTTYPGPFELTSIQGSIAYGTDNTLRLHLHATLGDTTNHVVSGHLSAGTVSILNEIVIQKLNDVHLFRTYNPANGLWELDMPNPQP